MIMPKENDLEGKKTWEGSTAVKPACRSPRTAVQRSKASSRTKGVRSSRRTSPGRNTLAEEIEGMTPLVTRSRPNDPATRGLPEASRTMRFDWYEVARQAASFQGVGADVRACLHFKNVE